MKTDWIDTIAVYEQMATTDDLNARQQLFETHILAPFDPYLEGRFGGISREQMARQWNLLLPEQITDLPEAARLLREANANTVAADALTEAAERFAPYTDRITQEAVTGLIVLLDPAHASPHMRGYTGFQMPGLLVPMFYEVNDYNLPRLPGMVVHEFHHNIRMEAFPWDMMHTSVADYIVMEGLAEAFAAALYGEDIIGYYAADHTADQIATAKQLIAEGLERTGFNVIRGYVFGDHLAEQFGFEAIGMPPYGGYGVGYQIVRAYLERTGETIEAATFCPAMTIINESGYFTP